MPQEEYHEYLFDVLQKGCDWVCGTYLDIEELLGQHWWAVINWLARAIENSTKHFDTHGHSEDISSELTSSALVVDTWSTFENL